MGYKYLFSKTARDGAERGFMMLRSSLQGSSLMKSLESAYLVETADSTAAIRV
jgi:hypothetical protein